MVSSKALYYPSIDIRDEEWLKTAYLFWDEINTIVPTSLEGRAYKNNTTRYLEDEGYLRPYFVKPESAVVRNLVDKVKSFAKTEEGKACLNQVAPDNVHHNPYMDERSQFYLHKEKLPFEIQQLIGDKLGEDGWARVSDNFADYYMTILANAIASQKSMTLLTDATPLANLTTKCSEEAAHRSLSATGSTSSITSVSQSLLVKMIMDGIKINPLTSFQDLKIFKDYHRSELDNFRNGLDEITSLNMPDGIDYEGMVQCVKDIYDRKVLLAYNDLKAALSGSRISFLNDVSSICYSGITTTVLDTMTNLSGPQKLLVGAGVFLTANIIKEYNNRNILKRASKMSYLLSIKNKLE